MASLSTEKVIRLVIDSLTMSAVVIGNAAVILTIAIKSNIRTAKNALILSLAIADLCVGMFIIPNVMILRYTKADWKKPLCLSCLYLEYAASAASVFTISAMAIDRFRALVFPMKYKARDPKYLYTTLFLVWILALLYGSRAPSIYDIIPSNVTVGNITSVIYRCTIPNAKKDANNVMIAIDFILLFFIPALLLFICNVVVSCRLRNQNVARSNKQNDQKRKRRVIRLLLIMALAFIVCHLPLFAFRLHKLVYKGKIQYKSEIGYFVMMLSWINSILNILFYGFLNEDIKANFMKLWIKLRCLKSAKVAPLSEASSSDSKTRATVAETMATTVETTKIT